MAGFGNKQEEKGNKPNRKNQVNLDVLLKKATDYHVQGDLKNAERLYRSTINSGLLDFKLFFNLGLICHESQRTEEAITLYKIATGINPNHYAALMNLGGIYKDLGKLDQALAFTLKSLELQPDNPIALMNLGGIYRNLGNFDQALTSLKKSIKLKPDNPIAQINLGQIYRNLGQLDQALASTLKAVELKPNNHMAHMNLGGIYKELGQLDQALASTLKAVELKSNYHDAYMNLGSIYLEKGQLKSAKSALEKSLSIKKTSLAMISLSIVYSELGNEEGSIKQALGAVEVNKNNEKCFINLANLCLKYARVEQGIDAAMKAIEINERSENAYLAATKLLCIKKAFTNARRILEKGREKIGDSHLLDGELVRVKFLEGLLDDDDSKKQWADHDDFFYEDCMGSSLIISFGSNGRFKDDEKNVPSFDFRSTLKSFTGHDKLYIRDFDRNYYMNGIKNSAPSILGLTNLIMRYVRVKDYNTVTTIGASSGGFGALLYGNLIKADFMIAFNPQTVLDEEKNKIIKDDVFTPSICKALRNANKGDKFYQKCLNIRNFIPFEGKAVIHYSNSSHAEIDKRYAEYLQHDNCCIIAHESATHLLALQLKEKNMLFSAIASSINQEN